MEVLLKFTQVQKDAIPAGIQSMQYPNSASLLHSKTRMQSVDVKHHVYLLTYAQPKPTQEQLASIPERPNVKTHHPSLSLDIFAAVTINLSVSIRVIVINRQERSREESFFGGICPVIK